MKKITKFTTNELNQRAVDCVEFNNSKNKDETCFFVLLGAGHINPLHNVRR